MMLESIEILKNAQTAWQEILWGEVRHNGKRVNPKLSIWGEEYLDTCEVCLAGAYHLKKTGHLIPQSGFENIHYYPRLYEAELFLNTMRHGRTDYVFELVERIQDGEELVESIILPLLLEILPFLPTDNSIEDMEEGVKVLAFLQTIISKYEKGIWWIETAKARSLSNTSNTPGCLQPA